MRIGLIILSLFISIVCYAEDKLVIDLSTKTFSRVPLSNSEKAEHSARVGKWQAKLASDNVKKQRIESDINQVLSKLGITRSEYNTLMENR